MNPKKTGRILNCEPPKQWRQSEFTDLVESRGFEQIVKKGFNNAVPMTIFSTYTTKKLNIFLFCYCLKSVVKCMIRGASIFARHRKQHWASIRQHVEN